MSQTTSLTGVLGASTAGAAATTATGSYRWIIITTTTTFVIGFIAFILSRIAKRRAED